MRDNTNEKNKTIVCNYKIENKTVYYITEENKLVYTGEGTNTETY